MSHVVKTLAVAALALAGLAWTSVAEAADPAVGLYRGAGPCADQRYLNKIASRFDYQVRHVPNLPDVAITDFRDIYERRYQPESEDWPISRRYCGATVILSDGHSRNIWYLIEGRMGFIGIGHNVEFCVSGFDRWYVYNGGCRVLQ
ncbi:hypothetical protein [Kumtagia ephedrae]|uniref:Cytoplasmic protein n=1 Tax=Kumtagia ephedrae TaxID=2116701 RepID=A0A2P7SF83_9HYPH|nr:hypothetical protein [Mesorhizobium ephedrae]PSJ61035.1 hypothetical protein C7I84_10020 [Mesorhizobium ephedrae]